MITNTLGVIVIAFTLVAVAIVTTGVLYWLFVPANRLNQKSRIDNDEFDYGHDVKHYSEDNL